MILPPYSCPSKTPPASPLPPPTMPAMPTASLPPLPPLEAAPSPLAGELGLRRDRENFLCSAFFSFSFTCRATAFARRLSRSSSRVCWVSASWISDSDSCVPQRWWVRRRRRRARQATQTRTQSRHKNNPDESRPTTNVIRRGGVYVKRDVYTRVGDAIAPSLQEIASLKLGCRQAYRSFTSRTTKLGA